MKQHQKLQNKKICYEDQQLWLTGKQQALFKKLTDLDDLIDADSIWILLKNEGVDIGRATVYRTLNLFYKAGVLIRIKGPQSLSFQYQVSNFNKE